MNCKMKTLILGMLLQNLSRNLSRVLNVDVEPQMASPFAV